MLTRLALALALLPACAEPAPLAEPTGAAFAPTAASTPLLAEGDALIAVLADEGLVARVDTATGESVILSVGDDPTRVARLDDRLLVTLRGARAIAVLDVRDGALVEVDRVATGAEPLGIAVSPDGSRVYVALQGQDEVHELDADLGLLRTFLVPGRPSWLAVHPSGETLYVASALGGALTWFDLTEDAPVGALVSFPALGGAGREGDLFFTRRLTGDPAVRFDGAELALPGLWVDNTSPPKRSDEEQAERDPAESYEAIGLGLSPNNPGFILVGLDPFDGAPTGDARLRYAVAEATPIAPDTRQIVRSFLSSAAYAPDGAAVAGTMEGSRVVVVVPADPRVEVEGLGGFLDGPIATVTTADGPRGLVWNADGAWVLDAFALTVAPLPVEAVRASLAEQAEAGGRADAVFLADPGIVVSDPVLDATLQEGRLLFSSAIIPEMATPLSGLSCTTCHFESRDDGLSWPDYDTINRQTKSLAGPVSLSPPFTWTQGVLTVAEETRITSQVRLGGRNGTQAQFDAVAAWVEHTPEIDHGTRGSAGDAVERGRAIFARADVGCAACHSGPRYSDELPHDMYGLDGVDTASLIGVAASPPYLHDGSAPTLRAVLESAREGAMGDTSGLSEAEMDDLEAFLRSL